MMKPVPPARSASLRRALVLFAAATATLPSATGADSAADLFRYVPDESTLVVYAPSVDFLARTIAELGSSLSISPAVGMDGERLLSGFSVLSSTDLVDRSAGVIVVRHHLQGLGVICRVSEPGEWAARTGAKDVKPGLYSLERGAESRQAMMRDGVLAIGELTYFAEAALDASGAAGKLAAGAIGNCDEQTAVGVFVDVARMRPLLKPAVILGRGAVIAAIQQQGRGDPGTVAFWAAMMDATLQALDETAAVAGVVRAETETLELRMALMAEEQGQLRQVLARLERGTQPLIRGVANTPAAIICACEWKLPDDVEGLGLRFVRPMFEQPDIVNAVGAEKHANAVKLLEAMYRKINGYCVVGDFGEKSDHVIGVGVHYSADSSATREAIRAIHGLDPRLLHAYLTGMVGEIETTKSDGEGGEVEAFAFAIKHPDPDAERAMRAMYGDRGAFCMGGREAGTLFAMGPAAETPAAVRELLTQPDGLAENPRVAAAMKSLDPAPAGVLLIDSMRCVGFLTEVLRNMGLLQAEKRAAKSESPYWAVGLYLDGDRIRWQVRVPRGSLESTVAALRELKPKPPAR